MGTGTAFAAESGGWSLGVNLGLTNVDQSDMDLLISRANTREGGISTSSFGSAWNGNVFLGYRFSGTVVAIEFRPSFFYQAKDGTNSSGGAFDYSVLGISLFPLIRFHMLENNYIKFFSHIGIGFGYATGEIKEQGSTASGSVDFSGSDMGYMAGLGAQFCFLGGGHCLNIEGNLKVLSIERLTADKASGSFASDSLSQAQKSKEVEIGDRDFGVTMTGIEGMLGYVYWF